MKTSIAERTQHVSDAQLGAVVQHFDTLCARALATDGPDSYGELLEMERYPGWDSDPEAKHAAGWILGFSYASGVSVMDLAVLAAERTSFGSDDTDAADS
jgi:hypothetical protein